MTDSLLYVATLATLTKATQKFTFDSLKQLFLALWWIPFRDLETKDLFIDKETALEYIYRKFQLIGASYVWTRPLGTYHYSVNRFDDFWCWKTA